LFLSGPVFSGIIIIYCSTPDHHENFDW